MGPMQLVFCLFYLQSNSQQSFKGGSASGILEEEYESNNQTKVEERRDFANYGL